jgi:hypothetical protein
MMAHVLLEVKVSELVIVGTNLKKLGKLGIGEDNTPVRLVLEFVGLDVLVNLLGNSSAGHLGSRGLVKEGTKLVTKRSGLHKATGFLVARTTTLETALDEVLELTLDNLLKELELALDRTVKRSKFLEFVRKI